MSWAIAAISVTEQIEKYGAYAGLAAIVGLGVLSLLYFAQAREVKRLREWAGRAPERAAELESRVQAEATRRVSGAPLRPQTAAGQAATAAAPGVPATPAPGAAPAVPGAAPPVTPAPAPGAADKPATPVPVPVPGLPVPVPAASGARVAAPAAAAAAASPTTTAPTPPTDTPADKPADKPADEPAEAPAGGNGVSTTPPPTVGPRVPGRPPPGSPTPAPTTTTPPVPAAASAAGASEAPEVRPLRSGPPSRTLPPRDETASGGHGRPSGRVLGVIGGVALVIVAVVVVLIVSTGGDDTPTPPNQVAETTAQTSESEPVRTQSSRQQRIDREDTPVAVLNGTGINGLARQVADRLQSTGYQAAVDNTQPRPDTVIGYKDGAEAAAREIGKLLEVPTAQIQPMPQDLTGVAGTNAVVVVIGADKASD